MDPVELLVGKIVVRRHKNIARVRNCPDVTILNCLLGLCQLSFGLFVFSSLCFLASQDALEVMYVIE